MVTAQELPNRSRLRVGPWIKLSTISSLEAIVHAQPDFVCIDMCNGWLSLGQVADLLVLAGHSSRMLVRLSAGATTDVAGQVLDAGAEGLVFAHISSEQEAARWVAATQFSPAGTRGVGSTGRAGEWGLGVRQEYFAKAIPGSSGRATISIMIEDRAAVANVSEIAAVQGVDQLVVGTADLGVCLGEDPVALEAAIDSVVLACRHEHISAAIALGSSSRAKEMSDRGFDTIYLSNDLTILATAAAREFEAARGI